MAPRSTHAESGIRRSRGRPRQFDRLHALETALALFWERGFEATTTRDLERRLGIGPSSLYNEFGSKQAVYDAALDHYESLTEAALLGPLEHAEEGLQSIDAFITALHCWISAPGRRGCLLVNAMAGTVAGTGADSEQLLRRTRRYRRRVALALQNALKRAAACGEIEASQLHARASLLLAAILGINVAARGGADDTELGTLFSAVRIQIAGWRRPAVGLPEELSR